MRRIEIAVACEERQRIDFLISKNMSLSKIMQAYADYYEINRSQLCFRIRGLKIEDSDTAQLLNIRGGDIIRVTENPTEGE